MCVLHGAIDRDKATRESTRSTVRGAAAEGAVASCAWRGDGDGGAVAAADTSAAGAAGAAGGAAADISGRGEDEKSGDQGDSGFQLSLGRGPWAPKVRLCA